MHSTLSSWLERIESGTLPALPQSAEALARLAENDDVPLTSYAAIIDKDPGLTIALLRSVTASRKRRLTTEITTVEHALMLLGLTQVRALLPKIPVIDNVVAEEERRDRLLALCMRGNQAAAHAREWARLRKDIEPDEVRCAALLHDTAEILLWLHAPEEMGRIETMRKEKQDLPAHEAEYLVLGFTLEELTAELATRWGLPSLIHESVVAEDARNPRVTSILLATKLTRAVEQRGWYNADATAIIEQIAEHLRITFDNAVALVHRIAVEVARELPCARVTPVAAALIFPAEPGGERGHAPAQSAPELCLVPQPQRLREVLNELQRAENGGGMALKELLHLVTDAMHSAIGLNRVVFASLSKDRTLLNARNVICPDHDLKFSRFEVELRDGNLFEQMMRKPQALWLSDANREKFAAYLPGTFTELTNHDNFFALSIFVGDKPLGLFYADRHHSTCALDATAYHQFKELGLQAARTLAAVMGK